ncbi:MAG: Mov34/MPN/PAD-1 family protein [Myxococcales bacterium]|nr:Mov34/MPN/PAD-1 family protein [Myxococcales bacterium]MDD9969104.1 Mov34/MPN/PAD-1 family protein [Myxococcales bacterium]
MTGDPQPWIRGPLVIDAAVLQELHAHARDTYPSECCGFVSGPRVEPDHLTTAMREENEADKYHKLDPETFPRTSKTYFKINELRATRALAAGEENDTPIKVIYHSHCDAGAYFSKEDAATFASNNTLMWPCAFIVVSVMEGEVRDTKLWVHEPGTNGFRESTLTVR